MPDGVNNKSGGGEQKQIQTRDEISSQNSCWKCFCCKVVEISDLILKRFDLLTYLTMVVEVSQLTSESDVTLELMM